MSFLCMSVHFLSLHMCAPVCGLSAISVCMYMLHISISPGSWRAVSSVPVYVLSMSLFSVSVSLCICVSPCLLWVSRSVLSCMCMSSEILCLFVFSVCLPLYVCVWSVCMLQCVSLCGFPQVSPFCVFCMFSVHVCMFLVSVCVCFQCMFSLYLWWVSMCVNTCSVHCKLYVCLGVCVYFVSWFVGVCFLCLCLCVCLPILCVCVVPCACPISGVCLCCVCVPYSTGQVCMCVACACACFLSLHLCMTYFYGTSWLVLHCVLLVFSLYALWVVPCVLVCIYTYVYLFSLCAHVCLSSVLVCVWGWSKYIYLPVFPVYMYVLCGILYASLCGPACVCVMMCLSWPSL